MITKRLVNCDFLNASGFKTCLSNKAKMIYIYFLLNADDYGFVDNAKELAETLDRCEETFENTLFAYHHVDAIDELVTRRLVFEFTDKVNNKIYLIKHWFLHNKKQPYATTNYNSFMKKVELIDDEYQLKNHQEKKPYKEKEIKENKSKTKSLNNQMFLDKDNNVVNTNNVDSSDMSWDELVEDTERG